MLWLWMPRLTSTVMPSTDTKICELRDLDEEDLKEIEASKYDLNYISLMETSVVWSMAPG